MSDPVKSQLGGLLETLELLYAQARAYERALPLDNYPARAAVAALGELARQALAEARDLAATLEPVPASPHPFSPREVEVLTLVAAGLTNKEIAFRLGLSERTIQFQQPLFTYNLEQGKLEATSARIGWEERVRQAMTHG